MYQPVVLLLVSVAAVSCQLERRVGRLTEVFAWKQHTFDIDGVILTSDRDEPVGLNRAKRQDAEGDIEERWQWPDVTTPRPSHVGFGTLPDRVTGRPPTNNTSNAEENRFFIQYNNVPMGVERVGNRIFVCLPGRRYGIPATLNYIDWNGAPSTRSPHLKPYPDIRTARTLTSVYRTRADQCGRLWMVDTGRLELPDRQRQIRQPAIVIFDLNTNRQILRYQLKNTDLPAENTPTGLASITIDITNNDCADAYAYIPDLTTFGMIVYSLRENDSWRHQHNYYSFEPIAGNLFISNQRFSWSDGVFSVVLLPGTGGCKTAYFHSLVGYHEYSVSTCVLKNRTIVDDRYYYAMYNVVGNRGEQTQSTMHDYHPGTNVMFFAEIGRDALTCWNTAQVLRPSSVGVLARDTQRLSYPSDVHVTGDEVWVMANTLPRFGYATLDTNEYNFFVYRAQVQDLIRGTVCE